jgi:hypothetical protein
MASYRELSSVPLGKGLAALRRSDGTTLSRDWMVSRSAELLRLVGIVLTDVDGKPAVVLASSWRAGGVRSALDAGVNKGLIKALGRWKSSVWVSYILQSESGLQGALSSMWHTANLSPVRVGAPAPDLCEMRMLK